MPAVKENMDNGLKGLLLAAGTIITCIIVSLGFYIAREARDTAASGAGTISQLNADFNDNDKIMYDGLSVSGSEVLNVIKKFSNEKVCIRVKTAALKENEYTYYGYTGTASGDTFELSDTKSSENDSDRKDKTKTKYINPNATFFGSVQKNSNNVITCITFIQSGAEDKKEA